MNIDRRLEQMRERLENSKPAKMTVTFKDGNTVTVDPASVITLLRGGEMREIVSITANRPEYAAAAGIMTILCHPAPNRRIEDFE